MSKVVIDVSMSLDGFITGLSDNKKYPQGQPSGISNFDWYLKGQEAYQDPSLKPESRENLEEMRRILTESGAFIFGRRTYEVFKSWGEHHPIYQIPFFVLTHNPPTDHPKGSSNITFVKDGIESAVRQARTAARRKDIKLCSASSGKQALAAGLCDEILIHITPFLFGGGMRLFDLLPDDIQLEKQSVNDGPFVTHLRYRVIKES